MKIPLQGVAGLGLLCSVLHVLGTAAPSGAACTGSGIVSFGRALRATTRCAARTLRTGITCPLPVPPACAGAEMAEVVELLGGMPTGRFDNREQTRCQISAYNGARKFLRRRMRERARGTRRQVGSAKMIRLNRRCDVPVLSFVGAPSQPNFGASCLEQSTTSGAVLVGESLGRCLRPRLEAVANSLLGVEPVQPNIVLIVTDDLHPEGINSMPTVLSEIVDRGVHFANSFTTTPVCAPSRAGILTGQHATTHSVFLNYPTTATGGAEALDDSSTLATWLQAAGYRTGLVGKYINSYFVLSPQVPAGWDEWQVFVSSSFFDYVLNENGVLQNYGSADADYSTDVLAERATAFVEDSADAPFFLMLTPFAPHAPSTPAARHDGLLAGSLPWRPPAWGEDISDKPGTFRFFAAPWNELTEYDDGVRRQKETLFAVDEAIASILAAVEEEGLTDNTVVLFTTDHGILWGEHRWFSKNVPYEESVRIPLEIRYPVKLPAGTTEQALATNLDIAPTLAAFAGVQPGHVVEGRTLLDLLDGASDWRTDFVVQHFGNLVTPPWDCLRTERYKYVRHAVGDEELYDLDVDPFELDNQAQSLAYSGIRDQLSARLDELL